MPPHAKLRVSTKPLIKAGRALGNKLFRVLRFFHTRHRQCRTTQFCTHPDGTIQPAESLIVRSLAQELVEAIVERLAHDRGALRACSFVSRSWHAASVRVLFRCLIIDHLVFRDINNILVHSPHLSRHVRHLTFRPLAIQHQLDLLGLQHILCAVPGLISLAVDVLPWNIAPFALPNIRAFRVPPRTMHRLELPLALLLGLDTTALTGLLSLFESVAELKFTSKTHEDVIEVLHTRLTGPPFVVPAPLTHRLSIERVIIDEKCGDYGTTAALQALATIANVGAIRALSLQAPILFVRLVSAVDSFAKVAENVEEFSVSFCRNRTADVLFRSTIPRRFDITIPISTTPFDLSSCSSLRRIQIAFDLFDGGHTEQTQWDLVSDQLQRCPSTLSEITLRIKISWASCRYSSQSIPTTITEFWDRFSRRSNFTAFPRLATFDILFETFCPREQSEALEVFMSDASQRIRVDGCDVLLRADIHDVLDDDSASVIYVQVL